MNVGLKRDKGWHSFSLWLYVYQELVFKRVFNGRLSIAVRDCSLFSAVSAVNYAVTMSKRYCKEGLIEGLYSVCFWWASLALLVLNENVLCLLLAPDFLLHFPELEVVCEGFNLYFSIFLLSRSRSKNIGAISAEVVACF